MALCDYRLCDKCNKKAFYDANLNYDTQTDESPVGLEYVGDWAVICTKCAKEWKCIIVQKNAEEVQP